MPYKLVFFDLDGTLIDSLPDITGAVNYILNYYGYESIANELIKKYIGDGAKNLLRKAFSNYMENIEDKFIDNSYKIFNNFYRDNFYKETKIYTGVFETFNKLTTTNILFTNKPLIVAEKILGLIDFNKYFKRIIGPETYDTKKPDPTPILLTLKQLCIPKEEALMIGDSIFDIECAKNANIKSCAVTYGYASGYDEIKDADYIINNFTDLLNIL
ncbi:MAG: hypothetical protein A2086_02685 [Spirochaetes bacterium GWD1_27_9]|nr:MAG: hypothetical protein A2Z98_14570 [Spirochaetes bacterium GWB1_27_13]OHD26773.1 MAG: hypothetical protein A2Y34_02970 [Spirochaetes bacterium GWC1_27_15]OHD31532.1 MAG: hypothetical protein A2086_02685 [Spirochaetes bacterium GWD1_27_9]